jgi:hypothetical protein
MKKIILSVILIALVSQINAQTKSYKRGVSYGYHSENDMQTFSEGFSWWYNWAATPDAAILNTYQNYNVDFTPMAWNSWGTNAVNNWVSQDTNVKYILGFNEPNFTDQANMTPSQAAAAWPALEAIAEANDLEIVGPAVNYCGNCVTENETIYYNPFEYLDDFFAACTDCIVDHVAFHWYGGGNSMMSYIEEARQYNKPIWVTEFAAWDNSISNVQDQKNYLAGTVNFLERDPDVYRYAWFIGRTQSGPNSYPYLDLYATDGTLTELGQLYMDIPVYDPEMRFEIPGKIETEEYYLMSGLFSELTEDTEGFLNIGWTDYGDWAEYKIHVENSGTYNLEARVSGANSGLIDFLIDNEVAVTVSTPNTGGWQNWTTLSAAINLEAGDHILKMFVKNDGFNINWISFTENSVGIDELRLIEPNITPNPVSNGIINVTLNNSLQGEKYFCILYDVFGKEVLSKKVNSDNASFQLNLTENRLLEPGVYFLNISGKNGEAAAKIIVQ